jgi:flagellar biosynthesis GTPase FlhF
MDKSVMRSVFVKLFSGKTVTIDISADGSTTVATLRRRIADKLKLASFPADCRIVAGGGRCQLDDVKRSLASYDIRADSTLVLLGRLRGGMPPKPDEDKQRAQASGELTGTPPLAVTTPIEKVEAEVRKLAARIEALDAKEVLTEREEARLAALREEKAALREEKAALYKREEALRKKEEALRAEEAAEKAALRKKEEQEKAALYKREEALRAEEAAVKAALRKKEEQEREKELIMLRRQDVDAQHLGECLLAYVLFFAFLRSSINSYPSLIFVFSWRCRKSQASTVTNQRVFGET